MIAAIPTLNLIGPGRLGQTLARLWQDAGLVTVSGILGRNPQGMAAAAGFIGAGNPVTWMDLSTADITLIATPDDALAKTASQLADCNILRPGNTVFHCSGALASHLLAPLRGQGAHIASIHPLKSFADPALAITDFAGTYCGHEGDSPALDTLLPLFHGLGAQCFPIDSANKTLYHAGAVLACNALVALMHAALQSMAAAGVPPETAWPALRPLIDGTLSNLDRLGPAGALTGPIARGDTATVARQLTALHKLDPQLGNAYATLGKACLALSTLSPAQQQALLAQLTGTSKNLQQPD